MAINSQRPSSPVAKVLAADKAEAYRLMGQHLTKELLQKMFYDTWDGKLPTVYGADGNLLQIPIG